MKKLFLFLCLLLSSLISVSAQNLDLDLLKKLNVENPAEDHFWMGVTNSIKWVPAAYVGSNVAYGLIADDRDALRYSLESTMSIGISLLVTGGIKKLVNRPRPSYAHPDVIHTYSPTYNQSFPSGHTSFSFATATTMAYQAQGKFYFTIPVFTWSSSVGYSRMRLGRHYPSDVLVGALIGIGSGILSHWITNQIMPVR